MLVNNNDVQSINAALIDLQKQIQQIQNELKKLQQIQNELKKLQSK